MLKMKLNDFNKNVFNEFDKNWAILIAGDKTKGFNGMTISWGALGVLWNKNVAFVFVRKSRYTKEFIDNSDSVTLSFLSDKYKKEKALFGSKSGRDLDKFKETNLHPTFEPDYNGYYIAESDYVLKMKKLYSVDLTYDNLPDDVKNNNYPNKDDIHTMYVCEIKQYLENKE